MGDRKMKGIYLVKTTRVVESTYVVKADDEDKAKELAIKYISTEDIDWSEDWINNFEQIGDNINKDCKVLESRECRMEDLVDGLFGTK